MEDELLLDIDGPVARLTLNRPQAMNALNLAMLAMLDGHLRDLAADPAVRVLLLTGAGAAFCAGADLKEAIASAPAAPGESDFLDRAREVFALLRAFPKPVIAALNGVTMAGGLELAMCADVIVAADSATIGDGHANFGVYPGAGGAAVLPRLIPLNQAMYLLLTGKTMTAADLHACGLVAEIHPAAALAKAASRLAKHIARHSPLVLQRIKQVARHSADKSMADALLHEQVMLRQHLRSYDMSEGLQAFVEKRAPQFQGR